MVMVDDGADLDLASHLHCESAKYDEAFAAAREAIKKAFSRTKITSLAPLNRKEDAGKMFYAIATLRLSQDGNARYFCGTDFSKFAARTKKPLYLFRTFSGGRCIPWTRVCAGFVATPTGSRGP